MIYHPCLKQDGSQAHWESHYIPQAHYFMHGSYKSYQLHYLSAQSCSFTFRALLNLRFNHLGFSQSTPTHCCGTCSWVLTEIRLYVKHTYSPTCHEQSCSCLLENLHSSHFVPAQMPLFQQRSRCWWTKLNLHKQAHWTHWILWSFLLRLISTLRAFSNSSWVGIFSTPDMDPLLTNSSLYPLCFPCKRNSQISFLNQLSYLRYQ